MRVTERVQHAVLYAKEAGLMGGDTSVTLAETHRSIRYAQLGSLCPVSGRLPRTPLSPEAHVNPG